jgi:hypothetical protein
VGATIGAMLGVLVRAFGAVTGAGVTGAKTGKDGVWTGVADTGTATVVGEMITGAFTVVGTEMGAGVGAFTLVGLALGARVGFAGVRANAGATIGAMLGVLVGAFGATVEADITGARTGTVGTGTGPPVVGVPRNGTFALVGTETGDGIGATTRAGAMVGALMVGSLSFGAREGGERAGGVGAATLSIRVKETR